MRFFQNFIIIFLCAFFCALIFQHFGWTFGLPFSAVGIGSTVGALVALVLFLPKGGRRPRKNTKQG